MRLKLLGLVAVATLLALTATASAKLRLVDGKCPFASDAQIKVLGAKGESDGVMSEYVWLELNRPGWKRTEQALMSQGRRSYDLLYISKGRKKQIICFDITAFFGKSP